MNKTYTVYINNTSITLESTSADYVAITRGATKDTQTTFAATDKFVVGYDSAKLVITQRQVTFHIGTYTDNELVDERFTIEQNEMLPNMPLIKDDTISFEGQMSRTNGDWETIEGYPTNHVKTPKERQTRNNQNKSFKKRKSDLFIFGHNFFNHSKLYS